MIKVALEPVDRSASICIAMDAVDHAEIARSTKNLRAHSSVRNDPGFAVSVRRAGCAAVVLRESWSCTTSPACTTGPCYLSRASRYQRSISASSVARACAVLRRVCPTRAGCHARQWRATSAVRLGWTRVPILHQWGIGFHTCRICLPPPTRPVSRSASGIQGGEAVVVDETR